MIKQFSGIMAALALVAQNNAFSAEELKVRITRDIPSVTVLHDGKPVTIQRNQNRSHMVNPAFAKTSRPCPPFCIQPAIVAPGVETIAELEVLDYVKRMSDGDTSILLIDSRTPDWVRRGTIPGSINIPWTWLNVGTSDPLSIEDIMTGPLGVKGDDEAWDFSAAKTLVMFCNGIWCGQSPNNIRSLLTMGYPAEKIKWYRGGMQNWEILGLTTVQGK